MHTIIQPNAIRPHRRAVRNFNSKYRQPSYDCREQSDAVKLVVYVPGVDASGISIEVRGSDLIVTACKPHVVRVNWQALHLENAQRDYRLRLRLGHAFNYPALNASFEDGMLTLTVPKKKRPGSTGRWPSVA